MDRFSEFVRIIRAIGLVPIDDRADLETLAEYVNTHLTCEELAAFAAAASPLEGTGCREADAIKMARVVSSAKHVEDFLKQQQVSGWQDRFLVPGERSPFRRSSELKIARFFVKRLLRSRNPVPLSELIAPMQEVGLAYLRRALYACVRYLVAFPSLRPDDLVPVLGAWPGIRRLIHGPVRSRLARVEADQVFEAPILMADMTTVLAALSAEPSRVSVHAGDPPAARDLHKRTRQKLEANLASVPEWLAKKTGLTPGRRLDKAIEECASAGFIRKSSWNGNPVLAPASAGARWLRLRAKRRVKRLLDRYRRAYRQAAKDRLGPEDELSALLPDHPEACIENGELDTTTQALAAFAALDDSSFVSWRQFLRVLRRALTSGFCADERCHLLVSLLASSRPGPDDVRIETLWEEVLRDYLATLVSLGCIRLGSCGDGDLALALTGAGCYFFEPDRGFDFTLAPEGAVIVDGDFDVTFFEPSLAAEAEIARFAERTGRGGVGRLFTIGQSAIYAAAASGLDPRRALALLREACGGGIPENIEHEIREWFRRCRRVRFRKGRFECPDIETAARVRAAVGKAAKSSSGTEVAVEESALNASLVRKLLAQSIIVTTRAR